MKFFKLNFLRVFSQYIYIYLNFFRYYIINHHEKAINLHKDEIKLTYFIFYLKSKFNSLRHENLFTKIIIIIK